MEIDLLNTKIFNWAVNLYETIKQEVASEEETSNISGFYCPKLAENLKKLLPYFPLFSEV